MFDLLLAAGDLTGAKMNREKCLEPVQIMVILGFVYDSISRICRLSEKKVKKYLSRIELVLNSPSVQFKQLEKLVDWLNVAIRPNDKGLKTAHTNRKKDCFTTQPICVVARSFPSGNRSYTKNFLFNFSSLTTCWSPSIQRECLLTIMHKMSYSHLTC